MFHPTLFDAAFVAVIALAATVGLAVAAVAGLLVAFSLRGLRDRRSRAPGPDVVEGQWRVLPR